MSYEPSSQEFALADEGSRRIEELLDDVARLAAGTVEPRAFYEAILERAVRGLAAVGGAIWVRNSAGQIHLECQIQLDSLPLAQNWADAQRHTQLLDAVLGTAEGRLIGPRSALPGEMQAANPTDFLLVLAPLAAEAGAVGLIEVFQRPSVSALAQHGALQFLAALAELAADFHRHRQIREFREREALWSRFEQFTDRVHASLDLQTVAYTIVNDARELIGCDRLSVGILRGTSVRLLAVSGLDRFDRRAQVVRLLEDLSAAVAAIGEPLWHGEGDAAVAPQIETPLEAVLDATHARVVAVVPLRVEPTAPRDSNPPPPIADATRPLGMLIVERFDGTPFDEPQRERIGAVCRQSAAALHNAQTYEHVPLMPLWRALGRIGWLARARQLPKTLAALAVLVALAAALALIPADFDITAQGELQPRNRREVFATADGIVRDVNVKHGETVAEGQVLAVLRRPQLDFEESRLAGEISTAQARLAAVRSSEPGTGGRESSGANDKPNQLAAEEEELKALLASLAKQQEILRAQRADLEIRSPMAGTVLTWNVDELLAARPVVRGQELLTVADLNGDWVLEVQVPDDRIGHVLEAQQQSPSPLAPDPAHLPVAFQLKTEPGVGHNGSIQRVALTTETDKNSGASVLVTVDFTRDQIPPGELRPGATAIAKIHCGRRSLGYVWLHQLWETIQSRVLF